MKFVCNSRSVTGNSVTAIIALEQGFFFRVHTHTQKLPANTKNRRQAMNNCDSYKQCWETEGTTMMIIAELIEHNLQQCGTHGRENRAVCLYKTARAS